MKAAFPGGGFYLWIKVPEGPWQADEQPGEGPEWAFARYLARIAGVLVSPGD